VTNTLQAALVVLSLAVSTGCAVRASNNESFVAPANVLRVAWRRHLIEEPLIEYRPQEFAAAESDGKRVFVGASGGYFYALDTRDGSMLWHRLLRGGVAGRARIVAREHLLYIGTQGGVVYALDPETGAEKWHYDLKGPVESQPTYSNGLLYFASGENRVYALDAATGKWRWQYDRESPDSFTIRGQPAPIVYQGKVYAGFADGYLACLNAGSGEIIWARGLAGDATRFVDVDSTPTVVNGVMYVSSYSGGVYALDPKDGSTKWRYEIEGAGSIRVRAGTVYFSAAGKGLHALDLEGRLLWQQALGEGGELSTPLYVHGMVLVSAAAAGTYAADARSGQLRGFFKPGHGVTSEPTTDGQQVYVLSNGGYVYALRL